MRLGLNGPGLGLGRKAPGGAAGEEYDPNSVLLLHFDDNFTDYADGKMVTNNGSVGFADTTVFASGKSAEFGLNKYLTLANDADFNFGENEDFRVDVQLKIGVAKDAGVVGYGYNNGWLIYINKTTYNRVVFYYVNSGVKSLWWTWNTGTEWYDALAAGTEVMITVSRSGGVIRCFLNGHQLELEEGSAAITQAFTSASVLTIGKDATYGDYFDGTIDELRIVKGSGVAASFDPRTTPFPNNPNL